MDVASEWPVAQCDGDSLRARRTYTRRSTVSERAWQTRHRRRAASTILGALRGRRCFGWCRITCTPQTAHDERVAREDGPWRPLVGPAADKFFTCGILAHGFARIRFGSMPTPPTPPPPPGQARNPLLGVTLERILTELEATIGWERMARRVRIACYSIDPSVSSTLTFLSRTPWAREKVERMYVDVIRSRPRPPSDTG